MLYLKNKTKSNRIKKSETKKQLGRIKMLCEIEGLKIKHTRLKKQQEKANRKLKALKHLNIY